MRNPPLHRYATRPGLYFTDDGGADVIVRSETAGQVWLCVLEPVDKPSAFFQDAIRLFSDPGVSFIQQIHEFPVCTRIIEHLYLRETLFRMNGPNYGLWYVHLPKAWDGMQYGYRVDGAWDPKHGVRFNPYKFLLDPYGKGIEGSMELDPAAFSYQCEVHDRKVVGSAYGAMSTIDSLGHVPVSVAIDDRDIHKHEGDPGHPHVPWRKTVIYEMHVKGFTANAPWLPEELRGTYAGLAHPITLAYLQNLGVTTIELLPIQAKQDELFLQEHGRKNYWGYSTLSYFSPEPSYATKAAQEHGAGAVRQEVIDMVRALHEAGFEVIMDVVYNHTCEGGVEGPTVCWRGLDDLAYYRHQKSNVGRLEDTTGCGNTFDFTNTHVVTFAVDSLRYWAKRIGVDGFRFDLGVSLARLDGEFTRHHPFLYALRSDLLLGNLKLIMEPWDLGPQGWRTGQFGLPFAEWNDRFRDATRQFWLGDVAQLTAIRGAAASRVAGSNAVGGAAGDAAYVGIDPAGGTAAGAADGGMGISGGTAVGGGNGNFAGVGMQEMATRLCGSADFYATDPGRGSAASINYVACHDGFTLTDLTRYARKHNEANGENNNDGSNVNHSVNFGVEGPSNDPAINRNRELAAMNMLGTLLLSLGTPMMLAGDECCNTQYGNNNAYCQDNDLTWMDWDWLYADHKTPQMRRLETISRLISIRKSLDLYHHEEFFTRLTQLGLFKPSSRVQWYLPDGTTPMDHNWFDRTIRDFVMRLRGANEVDILIVINGGLDDRMYRLPPDSEWQCVWSSGCSVGLRPQRGKVVEHITSHYTTDPNWTTRVPADSPIGTLIRQMQGVADAPDETRAGEARADAACADATQVARTGGMQTSGIGIQTGEAHDSGIDGHSETSETGAIGAADPDATSPIAGNEAIASPVTAKPAANPDAAVRAAADADITDGGNSDAHGTGNGGTASISADGSEATTDDSEETTDPNVWAFPGCTISVMKQIQ